MATIPYNISNGRVLIITPQLTVKDTVIDSLNTEDHNNFWLKRKVLSHKNLPSVIEYEGNKTSEEVLEMADIVIVNIQKLQGRLASSLINRVEEDFFDMIIIDEAHHSPANTWLDSIEYFSKSKVVKLTATPYRTDGRKISGELIYNYKLSQGMAHGYVKSLEMHNFIPNELSFIMDGDETKKYSLEKVMELKDEEWISRNVAYSRECSSQVVLESISLLEKQKNISNLPHMIIAVACGINHAKQIFELYKEQNMKVGIIHSDMDSDKIQSIKSDISNNRLDVIVNVGMLGEGYDHKYLSIAAIFRPFRNKLPYTQFIGRILRIIPEATKAADNIGHVITHKHLYLDELWREYKKEIAESEIIKNLGEANYSEFENNLQEKGSSHNKEIVEIITSEGILDKDVYLNTELMNKARIEAKEMNKKISQLQEMFNISREKAEEIYQNQNQETKLLRPDKVYNRDRKGIDVQIREDIVPELMVKFSILKSTKPLENSNLFKSSSYRWIPYRIKDATGMLAVYFNTYLKEKIGKPREEWSIRDFEKAKELLVNQSEYVDSILEEYYIGS